MTPVVKPVEQPVFKDRQPVPGNPDDLTLDDVRKAFAGDWSALKEVVQIAQKIDRDRLKA